MPDPKMIVQVALEVDARLGDEWFVLDDTTRGQLDSPDYTLAEDVVWVDVSEDVRVESGPVVTSVGRNRELDQHTAGHARFTLNNRDRTYEPTHDAGPYAGLLKPMRRVRMYALLEDGSQLPVWAGYVDEWPVDYPTYNDAVTVVPCTDALGILAAAELDEADPAVDDGDTSGERVQKVLDKTEVRFPATRDVDQGISTFGATTYGANALRYLQHVATSEFGWLYVSAEGTLTFRDRHAGLNLEPSVTFAHKDSEVDGIRYADIGVDTSAQLLFNRIKTSGVSDVVFTAQDTGSIDEFMIPRTLDRTGLFVKTDAEAEDLGHYMLSRYSQPEVRFDHITVPLTQLSVSQQRKVLKLTVGDMIKVAWIPPQGPFDLYTDTYSNTYDSPGEIVLNCLVEGIVHRKEVFPWTVTLHLSSADTLPYLRLDDDFFGELDFGRIGV